MLLLAVTSVSLIALSKTGYHLKHEWKAATCVEPEICVIGGEIRGEPLGHTALAEATCTEASVCSVCGERLAEPLGHTMLAEATCTEASVCSVCGTTLKQAKGHTWKKATCVVPKTCSVCNAQEGGLGKHTISTKATYWKASECGVCGAAVGEKLTPAFEEMGISINAFTGETYDYQTRSREGNVTIGRAFFDSSSEVTQENGYSVVSGQITIKFDDKEARLRGTQIMYALSDYYSGGDDIRKEDLDDGTVYYFSVDYNGTVYENCYGKVQLSYEQPLITSSLSGRAIWWTFKYELYIPSGYDGCVICLLDAVSSTNTLSDAELLFRVK